MLCCVPKNPFRSTSLARLTRFVLPLLSELYVGGIVVTNHTIRPSDWNQTLAKLIPRQILAPSESCEVVKVCSEPGPRIICQRLKVSGMHRLSSQNFENVP